MMRAPGLFFPCEVSMRENVRRALSLLGQTETGDVLFLIALIFATVGLLSIGGM